MKVLLNDTSVLLNLFAADCLASIAAETGWQFAICAAVRDEAKRLRDPETGELTSVNLTPLLASGALRVLDLGDDQERTRYVELSMVVDDGEAMSIAIAVQRGLELGMDDKRAINYARRLFPKLRLWTTPEILKHWAETASVSSERLRTVVTLIEARARYFPPSSHPLSAWWMAARNSSSL